MSAPKLGQPDHPLDNLTVIVDYNKIQLDDFTAKILDLEPLVAKWQGFGWPVLERPRGPNAGPEGVPLGHSRGGRR